MTLTHAPGGRHRRRCTQCWTGQSATWLRPSWIEIEIRGAEALGEVVVVGAEAVG
jgi:hypothetical protein